MLHGPGTALTLEVQEDSDVLSMFQARNAGRILNNELLLKDVAAAAAADRPATASAPHSTSVDWDRNGDPDLYQRAHLAPVDGHPGWGRRQWVFFGSTTFSGQRVSIDPGRSARIVEPGFYLLSGPDRHPEAAVRPPARGAGG